MLAYVHLASGTDPSALAASTPFMAVVVAEQSVDTAWRNRVADWLVQAGCLFMVAWGRDCSEWDDAVDEANCEAFADGHIPEHRFVMTTWHADVPMDEAFRFAKDDARHPSVALAQTVLVHVAAEPAQQAMLDAYARA
jgi:hypothetical protein